MAKKSTTHSYLEQHAEPEALQIPSAVRKRTYSHVLTIPAYDEPVEFLGHLLHDISVDAPVLIVLVVNSPDNAPQNAKTGTNNLLSALNGHVRGGMRFVDGFINTDTDLLVVDRHTDPIPHRQGVGLARKIAADIALRLIHEERISFPWIYMTDADARLPAGYFDAVSDHSSEGVCLFPFAHDATLSTRMSEQFTADMQRKADLYELHLRHYVAGLGRAHSPFAFPALGSTIAVSGTTYAAVRGMPKRNAAEDFYFLNKAAKTAPLTCLTEPIIRLGARPSARVPFGTGPGMSRIPDDGESYLSYAPEVFDDLGDLLHRLNRFALEDKPLDSPLLDALGWRRFVTQHAPGQRRQRAVNEWFDGFRTMKYVRRSGERWPDQPILTTLRRELGEPDADPSQLLASLRKRPAPTRFGIDS